MVLAKHTLCISCQRTTSSIGVHNFDASIFNYIHCQPVTKMMMLRNKADCIRWITFTLYLMVLFCGGEVEAIDKKYKAKQKRKRSNRGKKTSEDINLR